jgi:hypothetical protein
MTVLTPSAPVRSCTDQVTPGFADLLASELYRAWELTSTDSPGLCAPPPLHRRHARWAVITVTGDTGRVRGRMRSLLAELPPDAHAWPRPVAASTYAVGLGRTPVDREVVNRWAAGLPEAEVTFVDNGGMPTLR